MIGEVTLEEMRPLISKFTILPLSADSHLYKDLYFRWKDGLKFLEAFAAEFRVDLSYCRPPEHFIRRGNPFVMFIVMTPMLVLQFMNIRGFHHHNIKDEDNLLYCRSIHAADNCIQTLTYWINFVLFVAGILYLAVFIYSLKNRNKFKEPIIDLTVADWVRPDDFLTQLMDSGYQLLPISLTDLLTYSSIPAHHRDPFDRMLITQAKSQGLILISEDREMKLYSDLITLIQ